MSAERKTLTIYVPDLVWAELKKQAIISNQDASDVFGSYLQDWQVGNHFNLGLKSKKGALGPGRKRSLMLTAERLDDLRREARLAGCSVSQFVRKLLIHGIPLIRLAYQASDAHPYSGRQAYFEDDGVSAWLYLSRPDSGQAGASGWVYNRIPDPSDEELRRYLGNKQVPAGAEYVDDQAQRTLYLDTDLRFVWNFPGDAVAVLLDGQPLVYVIAGHPHGYSRHLIKPGPCGQPFDEALFSKHFRK